MKQETAPVRSFIRDYKLQKPNGIICFNASVQFLSEKAWFKFISPVQIITINYKHIDVIYLLNPDIDAKKIKTMFSNYHHFNYSRTRRFGIKGKSKHYGPYSIYIIPINSNCGDDTLFELNAKRNN